MSSIYRDILAQAPLNLPLVHAIHICHNPDNPSAKFGAIELTDGTIGLTYVKLGNAFTQLQDRKLYANLIGKPVTDVAALAFNQLDWQQVLGAGALNAISQFILKQRNFNYRNSEDSLALLNIKPTERVGMVGYFSPLINQLKQQKTPLTVIELQQDLVTVEDNYQVTTEPRKLGDCDNVLITGTSLINHTLEALLTHCEKAQEIVLIGPSVGLLPEALFNHGITAIGGRAVTNSGKFLQRWRDGERWGDTVTRYSLRKSDYQTERDLSR